MTARFWSMAALIAAAAAMRVLPHPPNFAPITAIALFGGARLDNRAWAVALPLLAMLASDVALELTFGWGFHALQPLIYATFVVVVVMGLCLRGRCTPLPIAVATLAASTVFFITTNFGVWALGSMYPYDGAGLVACYAAALPFFGWSLVGNAFYAAVLFGGFALAERAVAALAPRPAFV